MTPCRAGLHDLDAPNGRQLVTTKTGTSTICRECRRATVRKNGKTHRDKLRALFLEMYGGRCACCGIVRPVFLALDHVNNDGHLIRHKNADGVRIAYTSSHAYRVATKTHRPDLYQILCHNCNLAKAIEEDHTCTPLED